MKSLSIFLSEVFQELKKVHWPTQAEFITAVLATIVIVFLFSLFFALVDGFIGYVVKAIIMFFTA